MKVTIGRVVLYRLNLRDAHEDSTLLAPAIVFRVNDDGTVDLEVFGDHGGRDAWKYEVREGTDHGEWRWPARESR